MYSKQIEMFGKVAELGSFSKAAEVLYITPSAVIQQMNHLEREMDCKLLVRTKQGVTLTEAGEILYRGCQEVMRLSADIRRQITMLKEQSNREMLVGTSFLFKCRLLYELWVRYEQDHPGNQMRIVDIEREEGLLSKIDLMESLHFGIRWQREWNFLELCKMPLVCAVPKNHPLAGQKFLRYEDMRGQTLVTLSTGVSEQLDQLREEASHHGVQVRETKRYDMSTQSMCIVNQYLLQIPICWQDIYSDMVTLPCEWEYTLPYGLFYKKEASRLVQEFIGFTEKVCEKETFRVY